VPEYNKAVGAAGATKLREQICLPNKHRVAISTCAFFMVQLLCSRKKRTCKK